MKNSTKILIVIIIAVILIVSAVAVVESGVLKSQNKNVLTVEEGEPPETIDPAISFSTPGWEIDNQVYQGLIAPNGTSVTTFVGVLAQNWSVSSNGMNYTFYLRKNVTFSNGDIFTAYDVWYSIYRTILIAGSPVFILTQDMAAGNGINFNVTDTMLNTMSFTSPNSSSLAVMEYPNQSVQVVNKYEVILHQGYGYNGNLPYNAFLMTLTTPMAAIVDPAVVDAHGGVTAGAPNNWMVANATGTGPYYIYSYSPGSVITLKATPHYWGNSLPSNESNYAIAPPHIQTVVIEYKSLTARISDIKSGHAQIIEAPIQQYNSLKGISNVNVNLLPIQFGSSQGAYFVYMSPNAFSPFQNTDVRKAVTFAINYTGITSAVFDGYAQQWIGPVPPGFQYYNQSISGLSYYPYNPIEAAHFLAAAGYRAILPNGTVLNPGSPRLPSVNFLYTSDSTSETETATIIQANLATIGITISLVPLTFSAYENAVFSNQTNNTQYAMGINFYTEDYSASIDYVSAIADGVYLGTSGYYNSSVFNATVNASSSSNSSAVIQNLSFISQTLYNQYIMPWLYVPDFMTVTENGVTGMIPNPAGSGAGYFMYYSTIEYT